MLTLEGLALCMTRNLNLILDVHTSGFVWTLAIVEVLTWGRLSVARIVFLRTSFGQWLAISMADTFAESVVTSYAMTIQSFNAFVTSVVN